MFSCLCIGSMFLLSMDVPRSLTEMEMVRSMKMFFQVNEEVVQFEGGFSLLDLHASAHLSSYDARKYFPDRPRSDAGLCLR